MKRMMGLALVLALGLVGVWVASSYWFGVQTEREYHAMMARAAEWQHFKLTGEGYSRGVFRSDARATLELRTPPPSRQGAAEEEVPPFKLMLTHEIVHGPLPIGVVPETLRIVHPALAVVKTKLSLDPQFKGLLNGIKLPDGAVPPLDVITVLQWAGDGSTHLAIYPYRGNIGEEHSVAVDFSGLKSSVHFSPGFNRFNGSISLDGLSASIPEEGDFSVKRMELTFNQHEGVSGFYLGDAICGLEHLDLKHRDPAKAERDLSLTGVSVKTVAQEVGNDLSSSALFVMDRLAVGAETYENAGFEMELRKLDSGALGEFQRALKAIQKSAATAEQVSEQSLTALLVLLPKLLKHSPEVEIRQAGFTASDGEIRVGATLSVDGKKIQGAISLPMLLQSASLEATLSAAEMTLVRLLKTMWSPETSGGSPGGQAISPPRPETVEEQEANIRSTLSSLTAQRFLVLENGVYRANARFAGGMLKLNGKAIPLEQLLGP